VMELPPRPRFAYKKWSGASEGSQTACQLDGRTTPSDI
jgi:hypothetical protein